MSQVTGAQSTRIIRIGGFLAILYGGLGVFAGLSGAGTYIPFQVQNRQTFETAAILTAISAVGAAISVTGVLAGWWLLRGKDSAWRTNLAVALGCVATVAVFAAVMPASTPSPVPGGVPATGFLAVVAAAYGLEILILFLGRRPHDTQLRMAGGA